MNKYFISQIIYNRFKLCSDIKDINNTMNKLKEEVKSEDISQAGLERVLKKHALIEL